MTTLYLIRHGQAGTRENYDLLSPLGQQQAQALGHYWARQSIKLDYLYTGGLQRQQQSECFFRQGLQANLGSVPAAFIDERWSEFSLAKLYQGLVHWLCGDDESFAADFEEMQRILLNDPQATHSAVGRCDRAIIQAWMEDRYLDFDGERWHAFRQRIESCRSGLLAEPSTHIAIFTSATPIAIWTGLALGLSDEKILNLMGVIYNSSITTFRLKPNALRLISFNTTPHLPDPAMRTFR